MNKNKKIAMAVISTVMAGAMLVPLAACGGGDDPGPGPGPGETVVQPYGARSKDIPTTGYNAAGGAADAKGVSVKDGKLAYPTTTTLNMNICDGSNKDRHIAYDAAQISSAAIMPDNYRYTPGDLKPAWWQMSQALGVKFVDVGQNKASDEQITEPINKGTLKNYHIITGSGAKITENSTHFLNLNEYLEYMPNYKAFLDENEIVKWSLTSDVSTGAMYYAPYFDGNNDIEKYVITHREWTRAMLDGDVAAATTKWKESKTGKADVGSEQVYVTPFMGTTGSYQVDTTDPANPTGALIKVKVNYDAAKTAADTAGTELNGAIKAAYSGFTSATSGNIVDIQNDVIKGTSGEVTGAQLLNILRAYIDVAYQKADGSKFYATRSDVFNSTYAAWDVDLLVGLSRCVVTSYKLFGGKVAESATNTQIYAIAGRQGTSQRRMDLVSFVGELYGVRGLEPRASDNMYINKDGELVDARNSSEMYDAMQKLRALTQEGLVYTGESNADKVYSKASTILPFLIHDYSQTQTTDGFYVQGIEGLTNANIISEGALKFDFAPILTPVSKWDENENNTIDENEYFRFTESWRAVKNTGFCVPKAAVENKPEELAAVLAFIDYLFSNDGQIVATYGPRSTNGNATGEQPANGFWYATEATGVNIDTVAEKYEGSDQYHVKEANKGQYFIYENKVYESETKYLGRTIPTLTTNNINYYYGLKVNGHQLGEGKTENGGVGYSGTPARNYTNYARGIIGGALPLGNKDQGFEYQATAACGLDGSAVVSVALNNGSIRHLTQQVNPETYWYTLVPTTLPLNSTDGDTLGSQTKLMGADKAAGLFRNSSKTENGRTNLLIDIMFYGYNAFGKNICGDQTLGNIPADAAACIAKANEYGLAERIAIYKKGWNQLKTYYNVGQ